MNHFRVLSGVALAMQLFVSPGLAADRKSAVDRKGAVPDNAAGQNKGAAAAKEHKLSEWQLGPVLFGPKISKADLKGKVVVIEHWGVRCPPCIASLPHLAELDKTLRDKGLCVIGAEMWGGSKGDIKPLLDKASVEYTITGGATAPVPIPGVPRSFVFDGEGSLVYDGFPSGQGFENSIKSALKKLKADGGAEAKSGGASKLSATASGPLIPTRAWTNSDGREIRAAVKKVDTGSVTFLMSSGKEVVYPMDKLSQESRDAIAAAAQATP